MRATLAVMAVLATPAVAAAPAWTGAWHGPAGTLCLRSSDAAEALFFPGAQGLFYDAARRPVRVTGTADGALVEETEPPATAADWRDLRVERDRLSAVRGGRPLALARVALRGDVDDGPCGDPAFTAALLPTAKRVVRRRQVGGVGYDSIEVRFGSRFADSGIGTFRLLGASPAVARLNARLGKAVAGPVAASDFWSCMTSAWSSANTNGYQSASAVPEAITPRLVAWTTGTGYYCGGAHPDGGDGWVVHDLARGVDIDPWRWFVPAAIDGKPTGRLRALIVAGWAAKIRAKEVDADCADIGSDDAWAPHVVAAGVAFAPEVPHVLAACIDDVVIGWREVTPLLGKAGRADLAELRAALSVRPPAPPRPKPPVP